MVGLGLALGFVGVALAGMTVHEIGAWLSTQQTEECRHLSSARRPVEAEAPAPATFSQAA